ncbi:Photosystem I reaction center subunit VI [Monoraphidium neglectum]|uniref:Photosystem I reaction center subunit VI n=1 Tax=Monoraphidium neglectum TaxID=145388 RepID=A0A0D2MRC5_9CHLO|nr:Photosystem I reaction center subunit VI [Monoraphidium neglectum]KIY97125.1 Photosystem I reaction center subunit VI [Monoraphidium neglectum]|eukprot:XP_013896145.1 Photosystem I reaction center subunit VI [Monoraphidium neglectum]
MQLAQRSSTLRASRPAAATRAVSRRTVKVVAAYGQDSRFVDLADLENTTGAWDVYGQDGEKRYNSLQSEFFTRAADLVARREAILLLLAGSGGAAISLFGLKGAKDAQLPITKGPQTSGENGKGGSVRGKL